MEQTTAKSFEQQLKEEKEKLLVEINEKIKKRKALMNPDSDNELLNK